MVDGLLEPALQQVLVAVEGNQSSRVPMPRFERQMKPVDGVEEEQRPDALVKILAAPAEGFQFGAFGEQFRAATRRGKTRPAIGCAPPGRAR